LTDSWLLEELVGKMETYSSKRQMSVAITRLPPYSDTVIRALDEAFKALGRSGTDVIDTLLEERYGLCRADVAIRPGAYMSAMKDFLDSGCEALERIMLSEIRKETGIEAGSIEEAVFKLRRLYS
jgi:hypothetical protein